MWGDPLRGLPSFLIGSALVLLLIGGGLGFCLAKYAPRIVVDVRLESNP